MKSFRVIQTCGACPSQWYIEVNGAYWYVRYRYGNLTVAPGDDEGSPVGDDVFRLEYGDRLDGYMDTATMLELVMPFLKGEKE